MKDQKSRILSSALALTASANESVSPLRRVSDGVTEKIVDRSLRITKSLPFSMREHLALRDVSDFITIAQKGHGTQRISRNIDLLPMGHPLCTRRSRMSETALRKSRADWIASDPSIRDDQVRSLVASAYLSDPNTVEYDYYTARLLSLPQGSVPIRALVAAYGDGNSRAARSARAKMQRRDRRGRFAWMGGGMSAFVRRADGNIYRLTGRTLAQGGALKNGDTNTFDIETADGRIQRVQAGVSEGSKAFLPSKDSQDGYSPIPANVDSSTPSMNESDVEIVEAPAFFYKSETYDGPGTKFTDDAYDVYKLDPNDEDTPNPTYGELDFNKPVYVVRREGAGPKSTDTVVQSWGEVMDFIRLDEIDMDKEEGRTPSIVAQLSDEQLDQLEAELGDSDTDPEEVAGKLFADLFGQKPSQPEPEETTESEFAEVPEGAYVPEISKPYEPEGRTDQESSDYTDDPVQLANRTEDFSNGDLIDALKGGVLGTSDVPSNGLAQLPFDSGDEYVPAEAIYEALNLRGEDAKARLADIYDTQLSGTPNRNALKTEKPVAEIKDEEPEKKDSDLPPLLQGLSKEEIDQYNETGDYKPFLPKNESFLPPDGYYPMDPEPFENTTESPDIDPINLANTTETSDLSDALRESLEPGNEGMGSVLRKDEDGEDVKTSVPAESLRDALQLQGEDTNKLVEDTYKDAEEKEIAEIPEKPAAPEPQPLVETAVSEDFKFYSIEPNGEIDKNMQYTDEYIEHLFSSAPSDLTLSELSDIEVIHSQLPAPVKVLTAKTVADAKKELQLRDLGAIPDKETPKFAGDRYVNGAKGKKKTPKKPAAQIQEDNTVEIPKTPHIATVKTSELLPGDVTTKDNFVIEEVYADAESLGAKTGGMHVVGHYPGHVSQKTKIWAADTPIEVYRGVDAPPAGDKPELSKPKTFKYSKKNGGKGLTPVGPGEWEPSDPKDKAEYLKDLEEYEKSLAEAKESWSPPEGIENESYESSDFALSVDPKNPVLITTVTGPDLNPGDVTFKKEYGKDYFEYFVVESVNPKDDGTVEVTGFYPGHETQTKTWQAKTPISVMRGINEDQMPQKGDLAALDRPKKGEEDYAEKKKAFDEAKKQSASTWSVPEGIDLEVSDAKSPKKPKTAIQQPFFGPKMEELLKEADGDPAKLAELLQEQEIVYFDFETDGNGKPSSQRPIQVAAYKYKNGEIVGEYVTYMNPETNLGSFYTGKDPETILKDSDGNPISDEFLSKQKSIQEGIQGLIDFMGPEPIVVAHNAPFDLGILEREAKDFGVDFVPGGVIDTLGLSRATYDGPGHTLQDVANRYLLAGEGTDWHDARTDAAVLEGVVFNLLDEMAKTGKGREFLDFDNQEKLVAADKERYQKELSEWKKQKADYEAAKVVNDGLSGKEIPDNAQELIDKVNEPEKVPSDEVGPNDPVDPKNIETFESDSVSVNGSLIAPSWVSDPDNTTELLGVAVEDWKVGDFYPASGGGWWEIVEISQNEDDEKRMKILASFVGTGKIKEVNYIKFNKNIPIRRPNGNIEGTEPEVIDPPFEGASEPPKPSEDEVVGKWNGLDVVKGSDGIHYIKNISSGQASQLKQKKATPPALPLFVPLNGGNDRETGEGHYYDINGGIHYGKYGASGALLRRLNSDGEYEYLLGLRKASQSTGGNTWAFPAGAHKNFEDSQVAEKTAKTEFMEEVGEDISGLQPLNSIGYTPSPDWKFDAHLYEVGPGQIDNPTPKDGENQKFGWFTKDQIKQLGADGKLHPEFAEYVDNIFDLEGPPATPTPEADKEVEPTLSEISLELPVDTSGWIKGKALGGSNGARLYTDPKTGEEYVVKIPKSEAHARNEVLASALYEAGGVKVGRVFLGKDSKGETILISPFVSGSKEDLKERKDEEPIKQSAYEGFVLDAWMNNYDSVGLVFDNMVTVGDDVYRIDPGGALLFRAQGMSKKDQLTPEATQLDTLRDPKVNFSMGTMFGGMTDEDLNKSADALRKITPEQIDSMVDKAFADVSPEDAEYLKERLKARREDILSRFPEKPESAETPEEEVTPEPEAEVEAPEPSSAPPAVSNAIDAVIKDVMSFESVDQLKKYLDDLEGTDAGNDPQVQELIKKINDAQILNVSEIPDIVSADQAKDNDLETSSIDDELDGVSSNISSDAILDTYNPDNPDQIIDQINISYPGSNNGDGTWNVINHQDGMYQIVVEKNKDNTFSVIYVKNNSDGSVTKVDKYGTYHSFEALNNRIQIAQGKLLSALILSDADEAKMDEFFKELAKKTYWSTTGKSKVDLLKIKITHPSPDGATEINKGDQIWDSKTGKFGKVMYRFTVYAVKKGKYVYTDYVRLKFDDGTYTNAPTTKRVWKVGSDGKIIAKPGSVPEFFPNPGTYTPPKSSGIGEDKQNLNISDIDPKPSPEVLESPSQTFTATWEDEFGPPMAYPESYDDLLSEDYSYDKNSVGMYNSFGALDYNEYKEAIQGNKVKESSDKNILPSFVVEGQDGSIGVVTSIDPDKSSPKVSVAWIFGDKAGTEDKDISPKEVTSKELYLPKYTTKSILKIDVDYSIQDAAVEYLKEKKEKLSEEDKKKAEEAALKNKVESALVSGPGFEKVKVDQPPNWDQSIGESSSVTSALEKVKQDERQANNGADVLIDADQIENLKVRITQVVSLTDQVKTRLRFKLTDWAGNDLVKALTKAKGLDGVENIQITDGIQLRKFDSDQNPDKIRVESGVWKNKYDPDGISIDPSMKGRTIRADLVDDNGNVFGYVDIHRANKSGASIKSNNSASTNTNVSNHNEVDLYLNEDATPEDIERALGRLGISGRPATQQDVDLMVENKIISLFGGFTDPSKNLSGEERKELLQKIESDWGVSPSNVEVKVVDPNRGTVAFQMPREVAEKIAQKSKNKTLLHRWTTGSSAITSDFVYNLFFGNNFNSAILPTDVRMSEGINKGGMSSSADNNTIGADYVFLSGGGSKSVEKAAEELQKITGSTAFVFDIVDLIQNFDWYVTYGDKYGKRELNQNNIDQISNFTEFMARDMIPVSLVKGMSMPMAVKSELKKRLQQEGITEWNGIPVDKLFGLTNV